MENLTDSFSSKKGIIMAEKIYKNNLNIKIPTVVIKRRTYENIGSVAVSDMVYTNHFNAPNELSFTVHAQDEDSDIWDKINDYNVVYLPEYEEYFDMQVEKSEEQDVVKNVTCLSLCESELSQVNLYDIEINTEADIARDDYDPDYPTVFYRDSLKSASLLHRILDKAGHYSIGHVDEHLKELTAWYEFSLSGTTVYDALMGEIAEQYNCLFTFDAATRTVNAYDLCNKCNKCGYRGEFTDVCPECGSKDYDGAYGKDTSIYISRDNLAKSASIKSNKDSLKNCFHVEGGDDIITDAIASLNPDGTNYLYYFSPEAKKEMPADLVKRLEDYNEQYTATYHSKLFPMPDLSGYNGIINNINRIFSNKDFSGTATDKFHVIETTLENGRNCIQGYKNIIKYLYENTDLQYFIKSSMFPTIVTEQETLEDTLARLTVENLSPVSVANANTAVLSSIDRAVENYCRIYVNTALYKISTENTSLTLQNGVKKWQGTIKLTEIADKEHSGQTTLSISINSDLENFLNQKLEKELAKADKYAKPIIDMSLTESEFTEKLKLYNIDYLDSIQNSFQSCLAIIENVHSENDESSMSKELYDKYYNQYRLRIDYIAAEITAKTRQLDIAINIYEHLKSVKENERKRLDLKTSLGSLWVTFCSYRREDNYKNDNYASSNLTDSEIITKTEELLTAAKKELIKAGNMQFEVSADINNLLILPEFSDFAKDFQVGNWIHLMVDDTIYQLRLLSYQVTFNDSASISVEFSTLTKTSQGVSDLKSVISAAGSLSSSYSSFKQQMQHTAAASAQVKDWIKNGLDATKTKLVNDSLTQEIVINTNGILCRAYDDIADGYDSHQLKINRNALFLTNDNWQTIHSAIGKYYYVDPETHKEMAGYGVIADSIVGRFILGENLGIYNDNNSMKFDKNGLTITNSRNTVTINPNNSRLFKISKYNAATAENEDTFYCDRNGNLHLSGTIEATDGTFHGTVYATDGEFTGTVHATDGEFNGTVHATDGEFNGIVHATGGEFTGKVHATSGSFNGTIHATDGFFSGEIDSNKGIIGGFTISDSALYNGISSLNGTNEHGIYLGTDGLRFNSANPIYYSVIKDGEIFSYGTYGVASMSDGGFYCINTSNTVHTGANTGFFVEEQATNNSVSMETDGIYICNDDYVIIHLDVDGCIYGEKFLNNFNEYLLHFTDNKLLVGQNNFDSLVLRGTSITLKYSSGTTVASDERLKNSFKSLDEFDDVFLALNPCAFKFNNGTSDRFHFGFGAKQIRDSFLSHGFTTKDFGGFVQMTDCPDDEDYCGCTDPMGLIYTEFISWNTHMIQKLYQENATLKQRMTQLEKTMA